MTASVTPIRKAAGSPAGGQFAETHHAEADVDLMSARPATATAAIPSRTTAEAFAYRFRHDTHRAQHYAMIRPSIALVSIVEDSSTDAELAGLLPNLTGNEITAMHRDVADCIAKSELCSDALAAESAPAGDQLVDLADFGSWESDRPDEGETFGYDFDSYARALSEAWQQNAYDRAKAAVNVNDERAAAHTA